MSDELDYIFSLVFFQLCTLESASQLINAQQSRNAEYSYSMMDTYLEIQQLHEWFFRQPSSIPPRTESKAAQVPSTTPESLQDISIVIRR